MQDLPVLTTLETQRLRADYPSIEHLEAGNVAAWLVERQEQLLVRARDERTGMNLAKLITLTGGAVGAVCYATSPLALIGAALAGVGYVWAVAQDLNDSHQFAPIPFVRGNIVEFLSAMGDRDAREEWFANQNELVDLMFHLSPFERYEFAMLKENVHKLSDFLVGVEPGKRFYAYRWLLDWYIQLRGNLPSKDSLTNHLTTVTPDPRVNYQQVGAIQQHQAQALIDIPNTPTVDLPNTPTVSLPEAIEVDLPGTVGANTKLGAIDVEAKSVEPAPESPGTTGQETEQPPVQEVSAQKANAQPPVGIPQPASASKADTDQTSGKAGIEILDAIASTRRSTLLIGDTGTGKSVTQSYILTKLFEWHPNADVWVISQKADSFCGLAQKGRVILFDPTEPEQALILIGNIWKVYDQRRRLPESERSALPPVRLILADWLSVNQCLEELKNDESVKSSKYLTKLADIIYNGRELNIALQVDLQSYNLAAVGLKADRNSRKNFNLIGLGNYSIDELGMINESYGVLTNLISDRYIVADESERSSLNATFKRLQPISKALRRPIIFSGLSPARLALLPDLREYKMSVGTASKQPVTVTEPSNETQPEQEASASTEPTIELKVSDSLAEPLKSIWLFTKEQQEWVTVRDIQRKNFAVLKGKSSEQIHQYLGLLADGGYGEIDEEGKSHSSVAFLAH
jgi:hypothetical protein